MKKIVIIGPESTGKSTLSKQLAEEYESAWVPEYAREFLTQHGMHYTFDDLLTIAKGQVALEEQYENLYSVEMQTAFEENDSLSHSKFKIQNSKFLFLDTDMYVMKVWCEFVFGKCHTWILDQIAKRRYDLYLLCNTDLPWVKDELREYPDLESREKLYHIYKDIMINQPVPWVDISGGYDERLQKAIEGIRQHLS
jgi:NadR type nicotinamide-nucleotide adenylyltransferase